MALLKQAAEAVQAHHRLGRSDTARHMADALRVGASAVLAASIFHERDLTPAQVKSTLQDLGIEVRP